MRAVRVMSSRRQAGKDNSREPYKRYYWYSVAKCSILPVDLIKMSYQNDTLAGMQVRCPPLMAHARVWYRRYIRYGCR
jgi:hypothetical protein